MRTLMEAATGFPLILFTAALVVVVVFWLLVAAGVTHSGSFDADLDLDAWGMGGVPVAVALSLLTALCWILGVGTAVLLTWFAPAGVVTGLARPVGAAAALFAGWWLTRLLVSRLLVSRRPPARLRASRRPPARPSVRRERRAVPDEPGPACAAARDRAT
ncbi:hypothetical protein [Streptomyces sediminimaris]|uniref:hypothetical protein n=1 Tax=Streptomyces sediminimaris TaxID=3383721 RepID=UPI003999CFA0